MTAGDEDWPAVVGNLSKARKSWGSLLWILCWEGANARVSGKVFKVVVQAVLLFGAEIWVLTPEDGAGPGYLPARGRATAHRETTAEKGVLELGVSSSEGGHERGRVRVD